MVRFIAVTAYLACSAFAQSAAAQTNDAEQSKLEVSGSYWRVDSSGFIQANGTPVDLKSDLGVTQGQATFSGKLVVKPSRKHRIVIEGTPFRLDGTENLARSITYRGQTYSVNDQIVSKASLDTFYGGYQYDIVSSDSGHFGLNAGGAYLNATGTIRSATTGIETTQNQAIGLPLAGAEFRIFPIHRRFQIEFNGEVKGMAFGKYGHYVQAGGNAGVGFGPLLFEAGYRVADIDVRNSSGVTAITPRFAGPVFSVVFRIP